MEEALEMNKVLADSVIRQAKRSFHFVAASYLIKIRTERAWTLAELGSHLRTVPEDSIFFHTFQSLESHHYTVFSNDFAQWVMASCNETMLAEELGAIDLRDFVSLADLRQVLVDALENYLKRNPQSADRPAFEPFYFSEAIELAVPLDAKAYTLRELSDGIRKLSLQTLHFHFINSRLRLQLATNDFSQWIEDSLSLPELAEKVNRVDFYTNTLEGVRKEILETMERWQH
ncbi:MAG: hypothetical protein A3F68_08465 [Acidobacteria bacterium RIFCSPLOWO2_12_FULL_54_10]|nr:MAG: hypothetical protein A3F68_08465 [Acidobacteria bacterium RIFCSPLOWO2_12_FULL_54_10]